MKKLLYALLIISISNISCSSEKFELPPDQLEITFKSNSDKSKLNKIHLNFSEVIGKPSCNNYPDSELCIWSSVRLYEQLRDDRMKDNHSLVAPLKSIFLSAAKEAANNEISKTYDFLANYARDNDWHICKFYITNVDYETESAWFSDKRWTDVEIEFETIHGNEITLNVTNKDKSRGWVIVGADAEENILVNDKSIPKLW